MGKAKKFILKKHFDGLPKASDFELVEEEIEEIKENEIEYETLYLSLDPYMRPYSKQLSLGTTMIGEQVAKVTKSRNPNFKVGSLIQGMLGWRNGGVVGAANISEISHIHDTADLPPSLALGVVGMPGISAYFGLLKICDPKPGETLFVNSSAGIVGSVVGQIGKIKGCRVIGCAGSDDKCRLVEKEFGFDVCFNYKTKDLGKALKEAAPNGVDCYFDNVGGDMSYEVILNHMNKFGRITNCGAISGYNEAELQKGPSIFFAMVQKELKMQGFIVWSYRSEAEDASKQLLQWVKEGKLKYKEAVTEGFENMPKAFIGLLDGCFSGKVIVKASPSDTKL